jgi:very-short-patch-repair endonuclease
MLGYARTLRRDMTDAERVLWNIIKGKNLQGWKFRRQQPLGAYIADFYCAQARLIIEVDGGQHMDRENHDSQCDAWLATAGYRVMRFWNHEVLANPEGVVQRIMEMLDAPHDSAIAFGSASSPPPQGGSKVLMS